MRVGYIRVSTAGQHSARQLDGIDTDQVFTDTNRLKKRRQHSRNERCDGRFRPMRTTIDEAGRVVIPKKIRDRLGLHGNEHVRISERDGRIEIEPALTEVDLVREDSVLVAQPHSALPALTDDIVRDTIEHVRR